MASFACSILGFSILAALLAGYLGQRYLPPPTPRVVGIDLGTTYSCVGVYQAVTGEVRVIPDEDGHSCIPSVVAFSGDEIVIGYKAAAQSEQHPEQTIYDAKRFIGQKMSIDELETEAKRYPFKMHMNNVQEVIYDLDLGKTTDGKTTTENNKQAKNLKLAIPSHSLAPTHKVAVPSSGITPEHIGSYIVRTLRNTAERNLSAPVTKAVMAVPAEFTETQRNYTRKAASLAGIDVLRVINEPTAAALAYGLHKKLGVRNVMVVDLGGGTLDVSLLYIQGGMFMTIAMAGNSHLGGQDFSLRILNHFLDLIRKEYGQSLTDPEDIQSLRTAAESAKLRLTYHDSTHIEVKLRSIGNQIWKHDLTKEALNKINDDLFQKTLEPIDRILSDLDLDRDEVNEIVLVGGSTRIPKIREIIRKYFGKDLNTSIDPEIAVTLGVSIQAGILGGVWPLEVSAIEVPSAVKKIKMH